jgi:hypothetical protein
MEEFDAFLVGAAARIAPEYFLLPIHNADARYRERVYCYELYHQLRTQWPPKCPFFLNGEVDKAAHPYFGEDRRAPKPDFIIHVPGSGHNYAVVEVKSAIVDGEGIRGDIRKLARFRGLGYQRALYLLYGMGPDEALYRVAAAGVTVEQMMGVEIWVHPSAGLPAARAHD